MRRTLDSVAAQTLTPSLWIVVNDGSTDDTSRILQDYQHRLSYLRIITLPDRGVRSVGPGVIDAFYSGLRTVDLSSFDYLCKLDMDLDLPQDYFRCLIRRMEDRPRLGTCSGKAYYRPNNPAHATFNDRLVSEGVGDEMSLGMTKFYRVDCFREIGGFVRQTMWDGIDCHRCRMFGWEAGSWDDAELRFLHLRPMGSSHRGIWTGRMRHGAGQYFMGTGVAFLTASAICRIARRPFVIGAIAMWCGFVWAMLSRNPRYDDLHFRKFLRRYQWEALVFGKQIAADRALRRHQYVTVPRIK